MKFRRAHKKKKKKKLMMTVHFYIERIQNNKQNIKIVSDSNKKFIKNVGPNLSSQIQINEQFVNGLGSQ